MIHVLTVHWQDDRWIDIQLAALRRHLTGADYKVWAFLTGEPERHHDKFDKAVCEPVRSHAVKLNLLAALVSEAAPDEDLLVFLDGDAFPVAELAPALKRGLELHPLMAIQRLENNGDPQPHPSFCAATVGFWREIAGDWKRGHEWRGNDGHRVADVGGNLLARLLEARVDWQPLHRSNRFELHPVFYGIYADLIYHHGAGFRQPATRREIAEQIGPLAARFSAMLERRLGVPTLAPLRRWVDPKERARRRVAASNAQTSELVFRSLSRDPRFFARLRGEMPFDDDSPDDSETSRLWASVRELVER